MSAPDSGLSSLDRMALPAELPLVCHPEAVVLPLALASFNLPEQQVLPLLEEAGSVPLMGLVPEADMPAKAVPGVACQILQWVRLPEGRVRVQVQGLARILVRAKKPDASGQVLGKVTAVSDQPDKDRLLACEAKLRTLRFGLAELRESGRYFTPELFEAVLAQKEPGRAADLAATMLSPDGADLKDMLVDFSPSSRLSKVLDLLQRERDVQQVQLQISTQAQVEMDKMQREYFLRQQLKAIQEELGEGSEVQEEIRLYREKMAEVDPPEDIQKELDSSLERLSRMHPDSPESSSLRTYLDTLTNLPWSKAAKSRVNMKRAHQTLEKEHFGLNKAKQRILEVLAVCKMNPSAQGPVMCLTGPPGVGKTSLARSIAHALNRPFVRISLGGVKDEAEIRGHRRTYVGAMPGRVVQALIQAGVNNPVVLLDELDKLGSDGVGDPTAALLEVLDPEQNHGFRDHYLAQPLDLSKVFFLCTANHPSWIPGPLHDRLEVLELPGYTEFEKLQIARRHLLPRQTEKCGLQRSMFTLGDESILKVVRSYTRESGVRQLERRLSSLLRKVALRQAGGQKAKLRFTPETIPEWLGPAPVQPDLVPNEPRVGMVTGLAWTEVGGELLTIEVLKMKGEGNLILTGQLGEVMQESARAAVSYLKARAKDLGMTAKTFTSWDLHVHLPEGAVPKDGPSAGVGLALALYSCLKDLPVRHDLAMTGEVTLRGDVLPVGGLQEKFLAALRAGLREVYFPVGNRKDLPDLPKEVKEGLVLTPIASLGEVLTGALAKVKKPRTKKGKTAAAPGQKRPAKKKAARKKQRR